MTIQGFFQYALMALLIQKHIYTTSAQNITLRQQSPRIARARDAERSMIEYKSRESFRKSERLQRIALISYINVLEHLQRIQNYRT